MKADHHRLAAEGSGGGGHLAELMRAEAELLSSHATHEAIAGRLGISPGLVRSYCNHLVQRSRLERCTHVQQASQDSDQSPLWDWFGPEDPRPGQGQSEYPPTQQSYRHESHELSFAPSPQYVPPPGQRQLRRNRHLGRNVLIGAGGFIAVVAATVVVKAAVNGDHTVTAGQAAATSSATSSISGTARVGATITLSGNGAGEQMAVTVTKVFGDPQAASESDPPQQGDRLYAVQFRLDVTGSVAYSDSPSSGALVVDSTGQSYQSAIGSVADCDSFPGIENIAVGSSGLGCIVFEVPTKARITLVQFTLDSGLGPQTGHWDVRS